MKCHRRVRGGWTAGGRCRFDEASCCDPFSLRRCADFESGGGGGLAGIDLYTKLARRPRGTCHPRLQPNADVVLQLQKDSTGCHIDPTLTTEPRWRIGSRRTVITSDVSVGEKCTRAFFKNKSGLLELHNPLTLQ